MKKILNLLASTRLTAILFLVFGTSMAVATFIENDYGTQTAKALVYNAWWFEAIMVVFVINFIYNISKYRLLRKEKWVVLMFHLSFIFVIIGAGITRYSSFEGMMPIKEGETSHVMLSDKVFLKVLIDDNKDQKTPIYKRMVLSRIGRNNFDINTEFKGQPVEISYVNYIANATEKLEASETGDVFLHLVESGGGSRHDHYIKSGEIINVHNTLISFNNYKKGAINFRTNAENGTVTIETPSDGNFMRMADRFKGTVVKDSAQFFQLRSLYTIGNTRFVVPEPPTKGLVKIVSGNKNKFPQDMLEVSVTVNNKTKSTKLYGGKFYLNRPKVISLGGLNIRLSYGAKQIELPFSLKLKDFQLDRYPGSMSPKSYASEITVIDKDEVFDFRIYMNHILDHKGYKFFQSSYNITSTYEETRLSVNHDFWGTWVTYIGYGFLYLGLILIFFVKNTRFSVLKDKLAKLKKQKTIAVIALLIGLNSFGQNMPSTTTIDSILKATTFDEVQAEKFGRLVVQDSRGRMLPINTFASELMRKVSKHENYQNYNPNQAILSMIISPRTWFYVPFIYIKSDNTKLRNIINVPEKQKYARFVDFFDANGRYKILSIVENANKQKIKNKFEQSVIEVDRRINLLYNVINGAMFRLFPLPNDPNNKWYSFNDVATAGFKGKDSLFVASAISLYGQALSNARESNRYTTADLVLKNISKFQQKYGSSVMPSKRKVSLELFYNKYDIFKGLFWKYMLAGTLMFVFVIMQIFKDGKLIKALIKLSALSVLLLFAYHTVGLGIRWYISGHAPWSNAYESMIYVAWATMLFGLIFGRKSTLTIAATAFVTSMILMIAHWNWMDPAIGNLVPVLDSYWLMIHVAIIVASYGPFTLGLILGMISLLLFALVNKNNKKKLDKTIKELTIINEMSLTVGLVMLTIGNFLGGMWANESWGRYWGWDPKETWALISIMVYAFVLHARLVPGLRGRLAFNILSVFAFTSILMTYLGVNHLLSGLHSYAAGETAEIPMSIYNGLILATVLSLAGYYKYKKYFKK
ncbi:MAG: cytochrome c biogenesis protein CcsA [Flavobacteriaceae bacterium]|nr:cytochrome c biogenesis protein CcsA [Flavobacteriaceae bacterium]